jgi:tetratricopeptide (TPR) repeat protein
MVVDLEDSGSKRGPAPRPVPAPPAGEPESSEERALEALIVEAEIFARYGLSDKAIERLRTVVRQRPELPGARERLLELMAATKNPALAQEAESFVDFCRQRNDLPRAEAVLSKLGLGGATAATPSAPPTPSEAFEEFPVEPRPASSEFIEDFESEAVPFGAERPAAPAPARGEAPAPPPHASGASAGAGAPESTSYQGLNSLLREEMQKAAGPPSSAPAPASAVDEQSLFADEQQFFNLAEELEKDLAEQASIPAAPAMAGPEGEVSLEEIFREFKKGVEQQLSPEDYETHSNLGIAYKEMGLIDEAIGEFQLASKDPGRAVECCSMLGLCFLEKGMPQLAIKWYRKGLETPRIKETETVGLLYDLAMVYQSTGDLDNAYQTFLEVYGFDTGFRDVAARVRELETVRKV